MRLTVRTLLAWLDHVLPAEEHRELDTKVAGSAAAHQLVDRVRRVVKQPTIPPPRLDGRGLAADPNSVAEYLDNCLEHEKLEPFERICVDSDAHLAEVAACHEILATLARDPAATAPIDAAARRRLLEAMRHHSAAVSAHEEPAAAVAHAPPERTPPEAALAPQRVEPAARRRATRSAWGAAAAALALLVALGFLLTEAISRSRGPQRDAQEPPVAAADHPLPDAAAVAVVEPPALAPAEPEPEPAVPSAEPEAILSESQPPASPAADPAPVAMKAAQAVEPPVPPASPAADAQVASVAPVAPAAPVAPGIQPRVPQGDALAIAAAPATAPQAAAPPAVPPAPLDKPPAAPGSEATLGFMTGEGLVIHRDVDQERATWAALAPGAALAPRTLRSG